MYPTQKRRSNVLRITLILVILAALGALFFGLRLGPDPAMNIAGSLPAIGASTTIEATVSEPQRGVSATRLLLVQGDDTTLLAESEATPRPAWAIWQDAVPELRLSADVGKMHQKALREGQAVLRLETSRAGTWMRQAQPATFELEMPVELTPPSLSVRTETPVVRQGGSGAVAYKVSDDAVHHGVRVGGVEFQGFPHPVRDQQNAALYGVPYDFDDRSDIKLFAVDELGNRAETSFLSRFDLHRFPDDDIKLSDGFFAAVVPEILSNTPDLEDLGNPLENYLQLNSDLRQANAQQLAELNRQSQGKKLWQGVFDQLPSSSVMAVFGDQRSYLYNNEAVDRQTHLGYDLASRKHAPVPAANTGVVVLARYFGIYGKTVVIDHGLGLSSLYSHLSDIQVDVGQAVDRGDTLGLTGETGLAGGDHLHFTVMVGDVMVDPIEWWDRRWVENRIEAVFTSAEEDEGPS